MTAIAGFAVLIASDIRMLRDFGFVTVIDLAAALLGRDGGPARPCLRLAGGAMRDRYSIAVGLLFLVVVVVASIHTLGGGGEETLGLDQQPRALAAARVRGPGRRRGLEGDANVAQDDCETLGAPLSRRRAPHAGLPDRAPPARSASAISSTGRW